MSIGDRFYGWLRRKACTYLHVPNLEAWVEIEIMDKDGNVVDRRKQRAKSWVRNGYNMALHLMAGGGTGGSYGSGSLNYFAHQRNGTTGYAPPGSSDVSLFPGQAGDQTSLSAYTYRAPAGSTLDGIVVGKGTAAWALNDYTLSSIWAHGYAGDVITYQGGSTYSRSYDAGTKIMSAVHARIFNNNSDTNADITEAAIGRRRSSGSMYNIHYWRFRFSRDIISPAAVFLDKAQMQVTYTFSLTYPS